MANGEFIQQLRDMADKREIDVEAALKLLLASHADLLSRVVPKQEFEIYKKRANIANCTVGAGALVVFLFEVFKNL